MSMDASNSIFSKLLAPVVTALVLSGAVSATALASSFRASDLSRWLDEQPLAQLQQMLEQHPRFDGQSVAVQRSNDNALTDAVGAATEPGESA